MLGTHTARFTGFGYPRYFMARDFSACAESSRRLPKRATRA